MERFDSRASRSASRSNARTAFGRRFLEVAAILALWGLTLGQAWAHKLQVFAAAEGARITGSVYFAGGARASGARVQVLDGSGQRLADLPLDAQGRFVFQARSAMDHLVVADSGDGHRAQWRVTAEELAGAFPAEDSTGLAMAADREPVGSALPAGGQGGEPEVRSDRVLAALVDQAVARQVRPLREALMAAEDRTRLRDVLGGIGYILGLAGLLAWWRCRRPGGSG